MWRLIFLPCRPIWSVIFKSSLSKLVFSSTPIPRRRLIMWLAQRASFSRSDSVLLVSPLRHFPSQVFSLCWAASSYSLSLIEVLLMYSKISTRCLLLVSSYSFVFVISFFFNSKRPSTSKVASFIIFWYLHCCIFY